LVGRQHIDGLFGFSQGAALAGLLAAIADGESAPFSVDFAIMVGGFTSSAPQHADLFARPLRLPSLHVIGRNDAIVPARDSALLAERFAHPVIIEHPGGHVIPDDPAIIARITDFVARPATIASRG
jgi:fermentation-respiration switch protein FrsA (DUF1100 family)